MQIEIREPSRAEMADYYRALPFAIGLPSWEPAPAAWHGGMLSFEVTVPGGSSLPMAGELD